ncbi:type II toxin-antitoxin system VapC family toxin [Spirulina major]|uniref:type II toxin-antitoxin system VapC family toxin n=1 Tax=Spirulina major TaxID=270636 RepID=UPI0009352270|nr:PIN domain-containing protein [Spirulina major]
MSLWILDTDHVSLFQRGHPQVVARVSQVPAVQLAIAIVTAEELIRGWLAVIRRAKTVSELGQGYTQFGQTLRFINTIQVVNFDPSSEQIYQELQSRKLGIGTQDLRIAAIAVAAEAIVVTRNQKDFAKVSDLVLADWTVA